MELLQEKIFSWLDKNYPVDKSQDNLIDTSFEANMSHVVKDMLGVDNITFWDWVYDRFGDDGVFGVTNNHGKNAIKHWYSTEGIPEHFKKHRVDKPAVIYGVGVEYWLNGKNYFHGPHKK